jgi:hypothetical protein
MRFLDIDTCDGNLSERLTVSVAFLISFSAFLSENDYSVTFEVLNYSSRYNCSCYSRGANVHFTAVVYQKYTVEIYFRAFFCCQTVYKDLLVFLHFELLPCYLYDCVHNRYLILIWRAKIGNFFNN